jgi:hypothetical protein
MTFETRKDIIAALVAEFGERAECFDYCKSATSFWSYNRLLHYYFKLSIKSEKKLEKSC